MLSFTACEKANPELEKTEQTGNEDSSGGENIENGGDSSNNSGNGGDNGGDENNGTVNII